MSLRAAGASPVQVQPGYLERAGAGDEPQALIVECWQPLIASHDHEAAVSPRGIELGAGRVETEARRRLLADERAAVAARQASRGWLISIGEIARGPVRRVAPREPDEGDWHRPPSAG